MKRLEFFGIVLLLNMSICAAPQIKKVPYKKVQIVQVQETLTDIDGNVYKTVKIGKQVWMVENLKVTHYQNGDAIPNVTDSTNWAALITGAWCNYDNDVSNGKKYGKLYNWYSVEDTRNLAPKGWHIPTDGEWTILTDFLGGKDAAGGKLKQVGILDWEKPNEGATNETGFKGLPGGNRGEDGEFISIGSSGLWWSSSEADSNYAGFRLVINTGKFVLRYKFKKSIGLSVRCLKD